MSSSIPTTLTPSQVELAVTKIIDEFKDHTISLVSLAPLVIQIVNSASLMTANSMTISSILQQVLATLIVNSSLTPQEKLMLNEVLTKMVPVLYGVLVEVEQGTQKVIGCIEAECESWLDRCCKRSPTND